MIIITRLHFTLSVLMFAKAVKLKESSGAAHQIPSNLFTYVVGSTPDSIFVDYY